PVGPRGSRDQEVRRVSDPLRRLLEEVARDALLEVDDAEAVQQGSRGVAVGKAPDALVREVEADPDQHLEAEVPPAAREYTAFYGVDAVHTPTLPRAPGAATSRRCTTSRPLAARQFVRFVTRCSGRCGASRSPRSAR